MIPRAKFKQLWNTKPDNSQLIAPITQVQLYRISQFVTRDWETYFLAFENLINKFAKEKKFNDKIYVIQDAEDL